MRQSKTSYVEDASEEETKWQGQQSGCYDSTSSSSEYGSAQVAIPTSTTSDSSAPKAPQTRDSTREAMHHLPGRPVGINSSQNPPDMAESYKRPYQRSLQPRGGTVQPSSYYSPYPSYLQPRGGMVQPSSYHSHNRPADSSPGSHAGHVPAEFIPIDRDPEKLVPFADLWQTESDGGELSTWLQPKSCLTDNTQCELLAIKTLEHGANDAGGTGATLICDNGPPRLDVDSEPEIHWLHIKRSTLSFEILEHLVSTCPFIPFDLMKVTLCLLNDLSENISSTEEGHIRLDLGTGLCYVGKYSEPLFDNDPARTESVIFLACPFLELGTSEPPKSDEDRISEIRPQSLLSTLYGYDVDIEREKQQIVQKMAAKASNDLSLQVRQTWILKIGNHVLVTVSNQDLKAHLGQNLSIEDGTSKTEGKISVRLQSLNGHRYSVTFDRDTRYADFHKHAVILSTTEPHRFDNFNITDSEGKILNETSWLQLISSPRVNVTSLRIVRRPPEQGPNPSVLAPSAPYVQRKNGLRRLLRPLPKRPDRRTPPKAGETKQHSPGEGRSKGSSDVDDIYSVTDSDPSPDDSKGQSSSVDDTHRDAPIVTRQPTSPSQITSQPVRKAGNSSVQTQATATTVRSRPSPTKRHTQDSPKPDHQGHDSSCLEQSASASSGHHSSPKNSVAHDQDIQHPAIAISEDNLQVSAPSSRSYSSVSATSVYFQKGPPTPARIVRPIPSPLSPHGPDTIGIDKDNVGSRQVRFSEQPDSVNEQDDAGRETASDSSPVCWPPLSPFFQWRPYDQTQRGTSDDLDQSLRGILIQVHNGLQKELKGSLYKRAFKCSRKHLYMRQRFQLRQAYTDAQPGEAVSTQTRHNLEPKETTPQYRNMHPSNPRETHAANDMSVQNGEPVEAISSNYDSQLMIDFFQSSRDLLLAFIPEFSTYSAHAVCELYWGAVDCICRQIQWRRAFHLSSEPGVRFEVHIKGRSSVVVGNDDRALPHVECTACHLGTSYASYRDALEHIHAVHGSCETELEHPHDDPCSVWLRQVTVGPRKLSSEATNKAMDTVEDFLHLLSILLQALNDLKILALRAGDILPASEGLMKSLLPPSLIRAFQNIMQMYILRSHVLSLKNRMMALSDDNIASTSRASDARRISELLRWESMAYDNVRRQINTARHKIILAGARWKGMTTIGIAQVGIHFLMCALIGNMQSQSPTVKLPPRSMHSHGTCLDLYREYIARLRFQCYRRPQRKLFFDIYSFEEELMAFQGLLSAQRKLLETFNLLVSSAITGALSDHRPASWTVERAEFLRQVSKLEQQGSETKTLRDKCSAMKGQVKQAIEVVEEYHGKAIRVFTIVTVFFLPLSFVSTFLGMNTTDVDGLKWDQSIFWITSLPITAGVLILAILYGYKGDEISDWFRSKAEGKQMWDRQQRTVHKKRRKGKLPEGKSFSDIARRPTTNSLDIDT